MKLRKYLQGCARRRYTVVTASCAQSLQPLLAEIKATGMPERAVLIYDGKRNKVGWLPAPLAGHERKVNIKAFGLPNAINRMVYGWHLRPSKARRAFHFAQQLLKKGIITPAPYAYIEERNSFGLLKHSYFISEQLENIGELRYVHLREDFPVIARQIAALIHQLVEAGVFFKDFSPGNVLRLDDRGHFALVDINRMEFHRELSRKQIAKYFERIVDTEDAMRLVIKEYASAYMPEDKTFEKVALRTFRKFDKKRK